MGVYADANVFLYAVGGPHPYRSECRRLVDMMGAGALLAQTSVETLQEVAHQRRRRKDPKAIDHARAVANVCDVLHPLDGETMKAALDLIDASPKLLPRDAIHVATARAAGLTHILTADRDFDDIEGLVRVDPLDSDAVAALVKD
jgi:predicted nucleic acid-binding protein